MAGVIAVGAGEIKEHILRGYARRKLALEVVADGLDRPGTRSWPMVTA